MPERNSKDDDLDDRRRAERVDINAEFAEVRGLTYVSDLSEHGVFVHTKDRSPIGTTVDLRFTVIVDDPVVLQCRGRVVRHSDDPFGMGVEFVQLEPAMILRINDVVGRQRPRELGTRVDERSAASSHSRGSLESIIETQQISMSPVRDDVTPRPHALGEFDDEESARTLVNVRRVDSRERPIVDDEAKTVVSSAPAQGASRKQENKRR